MLQKAGDHSAEDVLAEVKVPTLVIAAERDTFTPVDVMRELARWRRTIRRGKRRTSTRYWTSHRITSCW